MGTSYDGVYFYGLVYTDGDDDVPAATKAAFADHDADDFDHWLANYLGVTPVWSDGRQVREYADYRADLAARCLAEFGVDGFDETYLGYVDYSARAVYPKGAHRFEWRYGRVPETPPEIVETWRVACEKLAAVLPGADGPPGFFFGCSVG